MQRISVMAGKDSIARPFVALLFAVVAVWPAAPALGQEPPANVRVTPEQQLSYKAPSIARDPTGGGRVAVSYHAQNVGADAGCWVGLSSDGGATWANRKLIGPGGAFAFPEPYFSCQRPTIIYGPDGTLYYSYSVFRRVEGRPFGGYSTLFFTSSRDGGATFTAPVRVDPNQPPPDVFTSGVGDINSRIAVDYRTGRVYVGWHRPSTDFYSNADGFIATSSDGGASFSPPVKVDPDPHKGNLVVPTVGPDGRVYVAYQDVQPFVAANGAGPINLFVTSSSDGGSTFSAPLKVAEMNFGSCLEFGCQQDVAGNYTRNPSHDIEAGGSPGQVFVAASWYRPDEGANRSHLWTSSDAASSWSAPRTFGVIEGGANDGQLLPSLSRALDRLDIAYYNLRGTVEDTYYTSTDDGQTFSLPRRISGVSSNTELGPFGGFGNDAYGGGTALVSSDPSGISFAWVDSRRGGPTTDVFSASIAAPASPPGPGTVPPPPPGPLTPAPGPDGAGKFTAKMSLARATINRRDRVLDVLAPITARASGRVRVQLHAAGRRFNFTAPIDSANGRIRFRQPIPVAQARLGTGIVTIRYLGDADTRPQTVRLRAAFRPAVLRLQRPRIVNDRMRASGSVSKLARGVVRLQLEYDRGANTVVLRFRAQISNGRWSLNERLSATQLAGIAQRQGTVHSYTLFTGYFHARMRGEMRSFQVVGDR